MNILGVVGDELVVVVVVVISSSIGRGGLAPLSTPMWSSFLAQFPWATCRKICYVPDGLGVVPGDSAPSTSKHHPPHQQKHLQRHHERKMKPLRRAPLSGERLVRRVRAFGIREGRTL